MNWSVGTIVTVVGLISFISAGLAIINTWQTAAPAAASGDIQVVGDSIVAMMVILVVFALGWMKFLID